MSSNNRSSVYFNSLLHRYEMKFESTLSIPKNQSKLNDEDIVIPSIENMESVLQYNYNLSQLRGFTKHYKLKKLGTKKKLIIRLYTYLYWIKKLIIPLQGIARGYFVRKYLRLKGPALRNRNLCINSDDFATVESVNDIPLDQFFSFRDEQGNIYGFDILSFNTYLKINGNKVILNPFNRTNISKKTIRKFYNLIKINHNILKRDIQLEEKKEYDTENKNIPISQLINSNKSLVFHRIHQLGFFCQESWVDCLTFTEIRKYLRELLDIWEYRAGLIPSVRREICPDPRGPFFGINFEEMRGLELPVSEEIFNKYKLKLLECIKCFIMNGINESSQVLGCQFVIMAFTLINREIAEQHPVLYEAVRVN